MIDENEVRKAVEAVVSARLTGLKVESISVRRDIDDDGDSILIIDIVFDGKRGSPNSAQTSALTRWAIPKIRDTGETAFPVFSFIEKSDLGKHGPEAA